MARKGRRRNQRGGGSQQSSRRPVRNPRQVTPQVRRQLRSAQQAVVGEDDKSAAVVSEVKSPVAQGTEHERVAVELDAKDKQASDAVVAEELEELEEQEEQLEKKLPASPTESDDETDDSDDDLESVDAAVGDSEASAKDSETGASDDEVEKDEKASAAAIPSEQRPSVTFFSSAAELEKLVRQSEVQTEGVTSVPEPRASSSSSRSATAFLSKEELAQSLTKKLSQLPSEYLVKRGFLDVKHQNNRAQVMAALEKANTQTWPRRNLRVINIIFQVVQQFSAIDENESLTEYGKAVKKLSISIGLLLVAKQYIKSTYQVPVPGTGKKIALKSMTFNKVEPSRSVLYTLVNQWLNNALGHLHQDPTSPAENLPPFVVDKYKWDAGEKIKELSLAGKNLETQGNLIKLCPAEEPTPPLSMGFM